MVPRPEQENFLNNAKLSKNVISCIKQNLNQYIVKKCIRETYNLLQSRDSEKTFHHKLGEHENVRI